MAFSALLGNNFVQVAIGSAAGGVARYGMSLLVDASAPKYSWPWATLLVNVIGALAIGMLTPALYEREWVRHLLVVGLLGGFTTFSAFSLQACELMHEQRWNAAMLYIVSSVVLCLLAVRIGWFIAQALR